jgi:cysteine desulfurase
MYTEIYLDNSATTRAFDEVIELMNNINREVYGNPSSLHIKGIEAEKQIKKSRDRIASALSVDSREIIFTSGGTESNNLAVRGYLDANPRKGKHIITTKIEHPSILEVYKHLAEKGYEVDYIDVSNEGLIDLNQLKQKIKKDTALISVIMVNNEIGAIQPIEDIVKIKNEINKDTVVHADAVQAFGKMKIYPKKLGIDMLSISSHKIHGPKGVGALYVNKKVKIKPILFGGGQESLIRSGTENVPGISGFGLASEIIFSNLDENLNKVRELKVLFLELLKDNIEDFKVISPENSLSNILNISFSNIKAEVLLHHLEERKIYVSAGSACSSRKNVHSHVLQAIGLAGCDIEGAIRFSFSAMNSFEDIRNTITALKEILPIIQIKKNKGVRR